MKILFAKINISGTSKNFAYGGISKCFAYGVASKSLAKALRTPNMEVQS